ncbi:MAG: 30S ribosomal protein S20 [Myxococcales bacterium]|nr:30S ribosomal protein S20 [Myxococcales bacterium]MCB9709280.1 30S ribosomal protein S20 [Myxococcales bacterium]
MAEHKSALKRHRQSERRRARNRHVLTNVRTLAKRLRSAIDAGDGAKAQEALRLVAKRIDQAVSKGVYHRKTGSRYIARLSSHVHAAAK